VLHELHRARSPQSRKALTSSVDDVEVTIRSVSNPIREYLSVSAGLQCQVREVAHAVVALDEAQSVEDFNSPTLLLVLTFDTNRA
jgi:hypothetical protein